MSAVSVTDLLTRIRDAADIDGDQFLTDAVLLRWLNANMPRLVSLIARAGWPLNVTTDAIDNITDIVDGAMTLEREALAILAVYEFNSESQVRQLRAVHPASAPFNQTWQSPSGYFVDDLDGETRVHFRPGVTTGLYAVTYIAAPLELVADSPTVDQTDEVNFPGGWEEWLVLEVARQVGGREESVNRNTEERKREIEDDIRAMAGDRLFSQGPRVRDVSRVETNPWTVSATYASDPMEWSWL